MSNMAKEIEDYIQKTKEESLYMRGKALASGNCANCGFPIPSSRFKRKSYTCSYDCLMEFFSKYDYSKTSPAIREIKKKYREARKSKREHKTEGISIARKEDECTLCHEKILPGERYSWRIPQPYDDDWDDSTPWKKYKWHVECVNHVIEIINKLFLGEEADDPEDDVEEALEYAELNGGIRHFKDNSWHEIPLKKISRIGGVKFNKEVPQ